jgi:kynureninase
MNYQEISLLDESDPLAQKREQFVVPDNCVYLDGNSLGCLPVAARERAREVVDQQWGQGLITSWNKHGWIDLPVIVGEKIAALIGAAPGQTICCDSVSVNLFKLLSAALSMRPGRNLIVSQRNNFPTDLYMAQGLQSLLGADKCELRTLEDAEIERQLDDSVVVLMLSHANFRTGRIYDMRKLTELAHKHGILVLWDLAHSAGVYPVELDRSRVDFAVGCGYKYLNGGPGAPAFVYVAERHHNTFGQPLSGWMGHRAPFDFDTDYQPAEGISRLLTGTPAVVSMSILDAALDVFGDIVIGQVRDKSLGLSRLFMRLMDQYPELADLKCISPTNETERGSQLAYRHPDAFAICQALIAHGVVADFRAPDILRAGFSPLYLRYTDIWQSVETLAQIMREGLWRDERYQTRSKVT